jgi:flagellar motor switch protein FliM
MMMMLSQEEIDSLLSSLPAVNTPSGATAVSDKPSTGNSLDEILQAEKQKNYKMYNFKRPDKFAKDQLRALETIHDSFARQSSLLLSAFLRLGAEVNLVSVDQLTYDEFTCSMPRPITVGVIECKPLPAQLLMGISHEVTMFIIDRLLGGKGATPNKPRELTDLEASLIKKVMARLTQLLQDSWSSVLPNTMTLKGTEETYSTLQVALPSEIVAVLTFEITLSNKESGLMSLCFPYPMLEGIIDQLNSQHLFRQHFQPENEESDTNHALLLNRMSYAKMPVSIVLGGASINVAQLLQLQVNDVVKLNRQAGEDLLVCVNERPKFYAQPGTLRNQLAVSVTEAIYEEQEIKGFGLPETR